MLSKTIIYVVKLLLFQWLNEGMLSLTLSVGLFFVYRLEGDELEEAEEMGKQFKNLSQFGTFCLCNLSWLKIVFLVVLHLKIKRRISGNSERPNSYHTSMSPRNFPDTDTLHGFKCAPKILHRHKILAHSGQRERKERRRILLEAAVRNGVWCFRRCYLH